MAEQLTFDLPVRTSLSRGDFFVSDANALAVARIETPQSWPERRLVLVGPAGAGKTHLAQVWAEANGAGVLSTQDFTVNPLTDPRTPVAVEDADTLPGTAEPALLHLVNLCRERELALLLTAKTPPARWPTALPDLRSRMEATDLVRIKEPDDMLLAAVLVKLFTDRQVQVTPNLIGWLTPRMERSFAGAQRLVAELDAAALAEGRPIGRALAQEVLDKLHGAAR